MLYPSMEPNERFRARRDQDTPPQAPSPGCGAWPSLGAAVLAVAAGMTLVGKGGVARGRREASRRAGAGAGSPTATKPRPLPVEIRGVHVTGPLASLPGKLEEYVGLHEAWAQHDRARPQGRGRRDRQLSVRPPSHWRSRSALPGANFKPAGGRSSRQASSGAVYLIGRIVAFQDPVLAGGAPRPRGPQPPGGGGVDNAPEGSPG